MKLKNLMFILLGLSLFVVPVVAMHNSWLYSLIDQKTFTCPEGNTKCYIELWKDGHLAGRKLVKPGESVDAKFFAGNRTNTTETNTTSPVRNNTEVNCTSVGGSCIPKASLFRCSTEYFKTEDCKSSEKCCIVI